MTDVSWYEFNRNHIEISNFFYKKFKSNIFTKIDKEKAFNQIINNVLSDDLTEKSKIEYFYKSLRLLKKKVGLKESKGKLFLNGNIKQISWEEFLILFSIENDKKNLLGESFWNYKKILEKSDIIKVRFIYSEKLRELLEQLKESNFISIKTGKIGWNRSKLMNFINKHNLNLSF